MAIYKCKMCSGELDVKEGVSVIECDYCGTKQTVPTVNDEALQGLYNRANTLRIKNEFDKAEQLYEKILQIDETQAEAHWGLILCKFGIEYVEDPKTFVRVPTCHRTSFDSIIADDDYKSALQYADSIQQALYEDEAKEIDRIQKEILALSQREEPYDVFICYKETDDAGQRTQDSVIANDIYYQLSAQGYKVFYAAISLEDKLGSSYEPCIFAALNSAKVMLVVGTKPEYFNAVWVKNEWSRFLKIMKNDRSKVLIPCYKNMDAYELPEDFAHLQAQDMSKIGFINDIVRGISKVINKDDSAPIFQQSEGAYSVAPLIERVFLFLEDGDWKSAAEYCEKVLDLEPKNGLAYLGKLMVDLKVTNRESLAELSEPFSSNGNYAKLMRFANSELKSEVNGYLQKAQDNYIKENGSSIYAEAKKAFNRAKTKADFYAVAAKFKAIINYKDSEELYNDCIQKGDNAEKSEIYTKAKKILKFATQEADVDEAIKLFSTISEYMDSADLARTCKEDWKIRFERYKLLSSNYYAIKAKADELSKVQHHIAGLKTELANLTSKKKKLEQTSLSYKNELERIESDIESKSEKGKSLMMERVHLGPFSGRRKREIDDEFFVIQATIKALTEKEAWIKSKLDSEDDIRSKIAKVENSIQDKQTELMTIESNSSSATELNVSFEDVISELLSDNLYGFVTGNRKLLNTMLNEPIALKILSSDDGNETRSLSYDLELPRDIIDKIEGTDDKLYYVHKNDPRSESQLVSDFEKYFGHPYFEKYEILQDVGPEYFGLNPHCKSIQFLFKKSGKDVLAVAIVTYASCTHSAITNVKNACLKNGIKYLRFIEGYPNKEHYVVRRVLEELGEIKKLGKK